jgi:hypothetical protein
MPTDFFSPELWKKKHESNYCFLYLATSVLMLGAGSTTVSSGPIASLCKTRFIKE